MAASMTVLFWNVQGKDLTASIARMMRVHRIDFVVLAEIPRGDGDKARERLEEEAELPVVYANRRGELAGKTHLYSARSESYAIHRASNPLGRLNVFEINAPPFPPFILGAVHLLSKRNASEEDRSEEAQQVTLDLREECRQLDSNVLLICGDFNLNPFEKGMRSPRYFPAVMDRRLAIKGPRVIQERSYPMLYNPMWSLFGDHPTGPPGTYFHSRARSDALANDRPISPIARVAYDRRCLGRRHPLRRRHTKLPHERRTHPSGPCILRSPSHPPASKKNTMSGLHFWPEDMFNDLPSSPVAILKEAAKELGSATKGVVDAEVKTT